jgi:DNA-binding FrmR family transcriptional regulator
MSDEAEDGKVCGSCEGDEGYMEGSDVRLTRRPPKMKDSLITRLNRIEGQVRGVKGMVEKDVYCDHILNQIAAVQAALQSVGKLLLENHMKSCMISRVQAGDTEVVDELLCTIEKLIK